MALLCSRLILLQGQPMVEVSVGGYATQTVSNIELGRRKDPEG